MMFIDRLQTPIGQLILVADEQGRLVATDWTDYEPRLVTHLRARAGGDAIALETKGNPGGLTDALRAYFDGELAAIDGLPVETHGTPFQRAVWAELRKIRCGTTISYGELARRISRPSAVRAVGLANGANPVGVVVPCHRVIGGNGTLTGYGGGLERKRWLLEHEGALGDRQPGLYSAIAAD